MLKGPLKESKNMVLVSWAHARINWSIRLHLRPFLHKDEHENNANVLDIYSSGQSARAAKPQKVPYVHLQKMGTYRYQKIPEHPHRLWEQG